MNIKNTLLSIYGKIIREKEININKAFDISYLTFSEIVIFFDNYKKFKELVCLYQERSDLFFYKKLENTHGVICDVFLKSLANTNIEVSQKGDNPYSLASTQRTVEILFQKGCDLNHKNKNGTLVIETVANILREHVIKLIAKNGGAEKQSIRYRENFYNRESLEILIDYNLLSIDYYNISDLIEEKRPRNFSVYIKNGFNINHLPLPKAMPEKYISQIYSFMLDNNYDFYHTEDGYHPLLNGDIDLYRYILKNNKYDLIKLEDILHVNFIRENLYSKRGDGKIIEALSEQGFYWLNIMPIYLDEINKNMHVSLIKITEKENRKSIKLREFSDINKSDIEKYLKAGLPKKSIEFTVGSASHIKRIFKDNPEKKELLEYMISENINVNLKNKNGHTLLSLFIAENMAEYCDLLLKNNIKEIFRSIDDGNYSSEINNVDCMISKNNKIFRWEALTEETYDVLKKHNMFENIPYTTELYYLSHFQYASFFHFPLIKYKYFQKLKNDGVITTGSINFKPCERTYYTSELIKIVKEEDMLDITNDNGLTALHLTKQLDTAEKIIEAGATIYNDDRKYPRNIENYVEKCFEENIKKNIKKEVEHLENIIEISEEYKSAKRERL